MLRVCSSKRSGTHFLLASIWYNFVMPDCSRDMPQAHITFKIDGKQQRSVPWANLFGSHYPLRRVQIPDDEIVYIVRNPLNVFKSLYKFTAPRISFDDFCSVSKIVEWDTHVREYWNSAATTVRYEDLLINFNAVLDMLRKKFKLTMKNDSYTSPPKVGWESKKQPFEEPVINNTILSRFVKYTYKNPAGYNLIKWKKWKNLTL